MFGFGGSVKIYYCPTPVNMRKSFDGLAGAVEEYIKQDPESGHVFAFFSRNKKLVKLLQWEDGGFVIWMKRLEQGMRPASPMVRRKRDFFEWEFTKKMNAVGL